VLKTFISLAAVAMVFAAQAQEQVLRGSERTRGDADKEGIAY
jgi:hypothetical protein